jgi:transcriptional pleiotropic repressor
MDDFLQKIRKLNWVLSESTTGNLSYEDLSRILSEITEANFYILDNKGKVLGVSYDLAKDTSIIPDDSGSRRSGSRCR